MGLPEDGSNYMIEKERYPTLLRFKFFVLATAMLMLGVSGTACRLGAQDVSSPAADGGRSQSQEVDSLVPDPEVVSSTLSNGFRYVLMENDEPKDRVSMHLLIQAGSFQETEAQQGVAHFLEHMMFNGSEHFSPGELVKYFQLIGMQFGPDANAHTGYVKTVYDVVLPKGDQESIKDALVVLNDYAEGALLLPEEIDSERGIILAEKRSRDSADYRTMVSTLGFEFPDARFAQRLPIGEEEIIRSVDQEEMKRFYDTWYRPERMVLVMVGAFDPSEVEPLIKKAFGEMAPRSAAVPDPDFGEIHHEGLKTFYHHEAESGSTSVDIEVLRDVEKKSDSIQLRREDIILEVAEQIVQNRLDRMLSDPDVPFTSASIHMGRFLQQVAYAGISAECTPEKWAVSMVRIEQTLRQALKFGFSEKELARVGKELISYFETVVAQAATRESGDLASEIIWHISNDRVFLSPRQERDLLVPIIAGLTPEEVLEAFRKAWAPEHRLVLVTGNAVLEGEGEQTPEREIRSVFERSSGQTVAPVEESATAIFPYLPTPSSPGVVFKREEVEDLGIVQVTLKNGVRLNLKKTDFEADQIQVSIVFGEGRSSEPAGKSGLAVLSEEVFNESGLGALDKNEIAEALAGSQVQTGIDIPDDQFVLRGSCASGEIELLTQLLYAHLVDPGFRQDAFALVMTRFEQSYQALTRDVDGAMSLAGRRFLAGGDSRFGLPSLEEMTALTLDDVRSWVLESIAGSRLEVNVVGDMEIDEVVEAMSAYFGILSQPAIEEKRLRSTPVSFPDGEKMDIRVDTQIQKGLVVIAYPTDDYWDIHKTRRLSVLADIFSEKLREKVREELGVSYSPFAYNQASRSYDGYGALQAYVYIDPEEADRVVNVVRQIARDVVENGISEESLERSLNPMLTSIKDYRRTNTYWLDRVLAGSMKHPEQLDWSRSFEADYASITVADIRKVAKAYLVDEKAACIRIEPE
jgi:zinc protease